MKKAIILCFSVCFVFLISCSASQRKIAVTKRPVMYEKTSSTNTNTVLAPAKELLKEGLDFLKNNQNDKAEYSFEEAIKLDPGYGIAYYWLARVRYKLGQSKSAIKLLNKAEKLLSHSTKWRDRIDNFRFFLNENLEEQNRL